MKLEIHRQRFGVTPDREWFEKVGDDWVPIPEPTWFKERGTKPKEKVVDIASLSMKPPKTEKKTWEMVTVYRVVEKRVPEYEAEVLCRNGWQNYYPGTLRSHDSSELQTG